MSGPPFSPSARVCRAAVLLALASLWPAVGANVQAQDPPQPGGSARASTRGEPPHVVATLGTGGMFRITKNVDLGQEILAPFFMDGFAGYLLSGRSRWGHGLGMGISWNLSSDGGFTEPVHAGEQWVLMPAYMAYVDIEPEIVLLGHMGVPFVVLGDTKTWGWEAAAGPAYKWLAGFGAYSEVTFSVFPGANSTVHPAVSLELGVFLDYEVLP